MFWCIFEICVKFWTLWKKNDPHRFSDFEIKYSKNVVREMSKKPHLREPFDKQHGKHVQELLKSTSQHLYHIHSSRPGQLSWKKSLLLTCQILGLLVNNLDADDKYPVLNRDNLAIPVRMQLSQKIKGFLNFLQLFWNLAQILNILRKKMTLIDSAFPKLRTPKTCLEKSLKISASVDPSTSNTVNVPKHCWNLHHSTFIIFTNQCQVNSVGKRFSYLHAKSWECLLTHWLPMISFLFWIKTT